MQLIWSVHASPLMRPHEPWSLILCYDFIRYFISYAVLFQFTKLPFLQLCSLQAESDHSHPHFSFLISPLQKHGSASFSKYHKLLVKMLTVECWVFIVSFQAYNVNLAEITVHLVSRLCYTVRYSGHMYIPIRKLAFDADCLKCCSMYLGL